MVRHGQSDGQVRGLTGGWTHSELTELGYRQGVAIAEKLTGMLKGRTVAVYSSDLPRALETARTIGRALGVKPIFRTELRELNNGQAAGMRREEAKGIEFPAGIMAGDETVEQTAVRELYEETGYRGEVRDVTAAAFNTPGLSNDAAHVVLMEVDERLRENANAVARPEEAEEIEVVLVGRERMGEFVQKELAAGGLFDSKVLAHLAGLMG